MKKLSKLLILLLTLALLGGGGAYYYRQTVLYPSTDNAYIQAHVINIAPRVNGMVTRVLVSNNQHVKAGQTLFKIDPQPFKIALNKAEANLANTIQQVNAAKANVAATKALVSQREAQLIATQKNSARILSMVKRGLYSASQGDQATRDLKVAKDMVTSANSQLEQAKQQLGKLGNANASIKMATAGVAEAKLNLAYTTVTAPTDGYLVNMNLQQGDTVTAFNETFALVADHTWWINANFKETQLQRIKAGQSVKVNIDMYPGHTFSGKIDSISAGSGASFSLLPPENATGNWVKVTQRFPVKITIKNNPKYPLRIGASCTVTVDTRSGS